MGGSSVAPAPNGPPPPGGPAAAASPAPSAGAGWLAPSAGNSPRPPIVPPVEPVDLRVKLGTNPG
eukprot:7268824-Alexandrium_andersonii.AAC.1